jgi:hypothetical protein
MVLMFPSSSLNGLWTLGIGVPGAVATLAIICGVADDIDFETGLAELAIVFTDVEEERDRKWDKDRWDVGRCCCVQPVT